MKNLFILPFMSLQLTAYASQSTLIRIGNGAPSIKEQIKTWEYEKQQRYATHVMPTAEQDVQKHIAYLDAKIQELSLVIRKLGKGLSHHANSNSRNECHMEITHASGFASLEYAKSYYAWNAYCAIQSKYEEMYFDKIDEREQLLREKTQMEKILCGFLKNDATPQKHSSKNKNHQ